MTSWKIELELPHDLIPLLQEIIYGLDADDVPTLSDFEIPGKSHIRQLEGYFTSKPDLKGLKNSLAPHIDLIKAGLRLCEIEDRDWVAESQKLLQPVDTGLFFIYGSHDADKIPAGRISLLVEAGQAFGTGSHETTHSCLLAIGDLSEKIRPKTALDLGCGSGVLALAMSRIWPITIMASDIDPIAADTTRQNAHINNIPVAIPNSGPNSGAVGILPLICDGFAGSILQQGGPYDVIVANILAKPLREMAGDIVENLSEKGCLILSGLLGKQENAVCAAYEKHGMELVNRYIRGEWHTLLLHRARG